MKKSVSYFKTAHNTCELTLSAFKIKRCNRQKLFIVTQKDTEKEDPQGEDLYEVGLLAVVRQVVKLQKNIMRVLIEGIGRAEIYEYTQTADYMHHVLLETDLPD